MTSLPVVQTSARDVDELFRCEHLAKQLALKHCLRRQHERKRVTHPRTMKSQAGEPVNGYCATACAQGRTIRAELGHVPAGHCDRCGTARVGERAAAAPCETCEALGQERSKAPARGFLPPARVQESRVIWTDAVPDVPIAPPPGSVPPPSRPNFTAAGAELAPGTIRKRPHEGASAAPAAPPEPPAHVAPANPEPPAPPAEETTMACPTCKSPTKHKADCPNAPGAKPARSKKPETVAPPPNPPVARTRIRAARAVAGDLAGLEVEQLLELRESEADAFRARQAEITAAIDAQRAELERKLEAIRAATERAREASAA
jgi:hypothetical protein